MESHEYGILNCSRRIIRSSAKQPDLDVRELEKRTRLMRIITRLIAVSDLGSREIARQAGLPVQKISDLLAGRLEHLDINELNVLRRTLELEAP